jgi:glycosyltransferase 2 family protein
MKNRIFNFLRIFISIFLIGILLWIMRDKLSQVRAIMKSADIALIFYGLVVCLISAWLIALRLKRVISVQSINITTKEAAYLTFLGYFFNNFLPTSFGGDVLKAYYAGKKSNNNTGAFMGVFMDRVLAMIPFTLIPVIAVTFFYRNISNPVITIVVYSIFAISLVSLWLILHKSTAKYLALIFQPFKERLWYEKIKNGYDFLNIYSRHKVVLFWSFLLSTLTQVLSIVATYIFARAIGANDIGIGIFFIVVPIVWIMTLIPSVNGLGIREGAFVYFFSSYMASEKALALSILILLSLLMYSIIGGLIYIFQKGIFSFQTQDL